MINYSEHLHFILDQMLRLILNIFCIVRICASNQELSSLSEQSNQYASAYPGNSVTFLQQINNPVLGWIKNHNQEFISDPKYIYISCMDRSQKEGHVHPEGKWLIIAKNKNYDSEEYSMKSIHWTNQVDVIKIIDMETGDDNFNSLEHVYCNRIKLVAHSFTVGKTSIMNPDDLKYRDKDKIYKDLSYFKTIEYAFFFQRSVPESHTGTWIFIDGEDGSLEKINNYVDGSLCGESVIFDDDKIIDRSWYKNGKLNGISMHFYPDGKLNRFNEYKDDLKVGRSLILHPNGNLWTWS